MAILADLTQATREELLAQIEALRAQQHQRITLKVTEKGAVSLYGLGQWPTTLYASQWERLLTAVPTIEAFLKANASRLSVKPTKA